VPVPGECRVDALGLRLLRQVHAARHVAFEHDRSRLRIGDRSLRRQRLAPLRDQPVRDAGAVAHHGDRHDQHREDGHQRRQASPRHDRRVRRRDRDEQELAVAEDADRPVEHPVEPARAVVRYRERPQVPRVRRHDETNDDLDHFYRQEGVEIQRLPDRQVAEGPRRRRRHDVAERPRKDDDPGVDKTRGKEDDPPGDKPGLTVPRAHPAVDDPRARPEHEERGDCRRDDKNEVLDGAEEHPDFPQAKPVEPGGRLPQRLPAADDTCGDPLRRALRRGGDAAGGRDLRHHRRVGRLRLRRGVPLQFGDQRLPRGVVTENLYQYGGGVERRFRGRGWYLRRSWQGEEEGEDNASGPRPESAGGSEDMSHEMRNLAAPRRFQASCASGCGALLDPKRDAGNLDLRE
jgi:hypothetical protein